MNRAACRLGGYVLRGGGEVMVWKAHDYENFMAPRPDWDASVEENLTQVVRQLASHNWPIRMHATYDETITRILNVFGRVFKETSYRNRWAIDHAETIKAPNIARIKAMGGGIAVQNRLAFTGEMFAERYGAEAAGAAFPLRQILMQVSSRRRDRRHTANQLRSVALALLDGDRQDGRWKAACLEGQFGLSGGSAAALHSRQRLVQRRRKGQGQDRAGAVRRLRHTL